MEERLAELYDLYAQNEPHVLGGVSKEDFINVYSQPSNGSRLYSLLKESDPSGMINSVTEEDFNQAYGITPAKEEIDPALIPKFEVDEDGERMVELMGVKVNNIPIIGDLVSDMFNAFGAGRRNGAAVDETLRLMLAGSAITEENLDKFIAAAERAKEIPPSKEFQKFIEDGGFSTKKGWLTFIKNPSIVPQIIAESFAQMINPTTGGIIAGGAGIGAVLGPAGAVGGAVAALPWAWGFGSAALESATRFRESLEQEIYEQGLEFNEENIMKVLNDKEKLNKLRVRSTVAGMTIGAFEAFGAKFSGNLARKIMRKGGPWAKTKTAGQAALIEGGAGGLGETGALLVEGKPLDPTEIGLEVIVGIGQGIPITAINAVKGYSQRRIDNVREDQRDVRETDEEEVIGAGNLFNNEIAPDPDQPLGLPPGPEGYLPEGRPDDFQMGPESQGPEQGVYRINGQTVTKEVLEEMVSAYTPYELGVVDIEVVNDPELKQRINDKISEQGQIELFGPEEFQQEVRPLGPETGDVNTVAADQAAVVQDVEQGDLFSPENIRQNNPGIEVTINDEVYVIDENGNWVKSRTGRAAKSPTLLQKLDEALDDRLQEIQLEQEEVAQLEEDGNVVVEYEGDNYMFDGQRWIKIATNMPVKSERKINRLNKLRDEREGNIAQGRERDEYLGEREQALEEGEDVTTRRDEDVESETVQETVSETTEGETGVQVLEADTPIEHTLTPELEAEGVTQEDVDTANRANEVGFLDNVTPQEARDSRIAREQRDEFVNLADPETNEGLADEDAPATPTPPAPTRKDLLNKQLSEVAFTEEEIAEIPKDKTVTLKAITKVDTKNKKVVKDDFEGGARETYKELQSIAKKYIKAIDCLRS